MSRKIEEGQELSPEDVLWLHERNRLREAVEISGCKLPEDLELQDVDAFLEEVSQGGGIRVATVGEFQSAAPESAPHPGEKAAVGVSFEVEDELSDEERAKPTIARDSGIDLDPEVTDDDEDEVPPYSEWRKADLEMEIARRNEDRDEESRITAESNKNADLAAALEADDVANPEPSEDDGQE